MNYNSNVRYRSKSDQIDHSNSRLEVLTNKTMNNDVDYGVHSNKIIIVWFRRNFSKMLKDVQFGDQK